MISPPPVRKSWIVKLACVVPLMPVVLPGRRELGPPRICHRPADRASHPWISAGGCLMPNVARILRFTLAAFPLLGSVARAADPVATMNLVTAQGIGEAIGTVRVIK